MAEKHVRERRATDHLPFSEMVTRGNLDDRLDTVGTRISGLQQLANERWDAHREIHSVVAESLRDYKRDANEWRTTLSDLRGTLLPKNEFQSEHRALDAKLHGEVQALAAIVSTLDTRVDANTTDIKTINTDRDARRGLFSDSRNLLLLVVAVVGIALAIIDRLSR